MFPRTNSTAASSQSPCWINNAVISSDCSAWGAGRVTPSGTKGGYSLVYTILALSVTLAVARSMPTAAPRTKFLRVGSQCGSTPVGSSPADRCERAMWRLSRSNKAVRIGCSSRRREPTFSSSLNLPPASSSPIGTTRRWNRPLPPCSSTRQIVRHPRQSSASGKQPAMALPDALRSVWPAIRRHTNGCSRPRSVKSSLSFARSRLLVTFEMGSPLRDTS